MNPIALVFALIAAAIVAPVVISGISSYGNQMQTSVASIEMARIAKAADGYITTYAAQVEANSTATTPAIITVSDLVNTGFLPNGFNSTNPYGQTWEVQVLQPQADQLQALVTSIGGQTLQGSTAAQIATQAGASGGVVGGGTGQYAVPGCAAGNACGAYAGWQIPTANYQNVAAGHLAALIEYSNGQVQNDYLYRVAVPGQPQLNTMQTNLNMGGNNVNNANELNAQSETLAAGTPNGQEGSLQIGSNYFYGDSTNAAVRTPGGFYVQNQNASGPASINEVDNINASGNITTPNTVQGGYVNSTGNVNAQNELTVNGGAAGWINNGGNGAVAGTFTGNELGANYVWSNGNIQASGSFTTNGQVYFNDEYVQPGWGCGQDGALVGSTYNGGTMLVCTNGAWQNAANAGINSGIPGTYSDPHVYTNGTGYGVCLAPSYYITTTNYLEDSLKKIYWHYGWYNGVWEDGWYDVYNDPCTAGVIWDN